MKKSGNKHNDQLFRDQFKKGFQSQRSAGIAQGAYAVCKVIHDKVTASDQTAEERLTWITAFCEKLLNNQKNGGDFNNESRDSESKDSD